nr:MAG: RNA-dependent RNA polymerase [Jingmen bat dicistrovirus 1]
MDGVVGSLTTLILFFNPIMATTNETTTQRSGSPTNQGIFSMGRRALASASAAGEMVAEMRPILEKGVENISLTADRVADLSANVNDVVTSLKPDFLETTEAVRGAFNEFREIGSKAGEALDVISKTSLEAQTIFTQLKAAFAPISISIMGIEIVPHLWRLAKIIANTAMAQDGWKIASFIMNAVCEYGTQIGEILKHILFTKKDIPSGEHQMFDALQVEKFFAQNKGLTVSGLAAGVAAIFQFALGFPPSKMDVANSIRFFGDRCRGLNSIVQFGKNSWSIFESIGEWIFDQVLPGVREHGLDNYLEDYGNWAYEVRNLHSADKPFHSEVKKNKSLIYKVEKLYRTGLRFSVALGKMQIPAEMRDHYQKHWKLIETFQKVADYSGVLGNKPRPKPLMVHLFGESGVGKSGATWPLASDFNASVSDTIEQAADIAAEVYFRNTEQEFWDGYAGQNVCVYDDFGQRTDTSAKPNEEFMELIRVGNVAAYPLHMAELQEKSRTKFISKFVILTSNVIEQQVSSLTFPSAYRRRIDVCAKVEVKEEFTKVGYNADSGTEVKRLDPLKCDGACDTRPYIFKLYNAESRQPVCNEDGSVVSFDYEEFLDHCLTLAQGSFSKSYEFNDALTQRVDKTRFERLRKLMVPVGKHQMTDDDEFVPKVWYKSSTDEITTMWSNAVSLPLKRRVVNKTKELLTSWTKLKAALALVGVVLGGLSIWKIFKMYKNKKQTEQKAIPTGTCEAKFTNHREKTLSRLLRHEMRSIDGFHTIDSVLARLKHFKMTRKDIEDIAAADQKQRFMIQGDKIRANQGHSYHIEPDLIYTPSTYGWATHFTHVRCLSSILEEGVKSMNRDFVHLYPGLHTKLPSHFSGRSAFVHVDLSKCSGDVWDTANGYVHVKYVPPQAITSSGRLDGVTFEAAASGDAATKSVRRVAMEASASGDNQTQTLRRVQVENSSSGDNQTANLKRVQVEASASGDNRTRSLKTIQVESNGEVATGRMEMWQDRTAQELISYRMLNNQYKIEIDGVARLNGLFIRDNVMLTNQHLCRVLKDAKMMRIWNMRGAEFVVPINVLKFEKLTTRGDNVKDAMLIQFPRYVNGHSDLVKHFQKMPELSERKANVCLPVIRVISGQPLLYVLGNTEARMETAQFRELVDGKEVVATYRDAILYRTNTTEGDCGSPIVVNDNNFIRKIAGIHCSAYTDGTGISIGQAVTQADLLRGLKAFETITVDADELPNVEIPTGVVQMGMEYSITDIITSFGLPGPTFGHLGICSKAPKAPGKTDLRKSLMYGYVESTTMPAALWSRDVNLIHKNVGKNALNTPYISEVEIDNAVYEVKPLLLSGESRKRLAKVYSFEEAVAGSDDSEYISGIARQTSPGYPWVLERETGKPGKTTWFGSDDWVFSDEVKARVNERVEAAKNGHRFPVVWSDTLKDERRAIQKVRDLNTRVFSHGPMDYTIAVRQYFIGFVAHIMENRIDNEQSIGTNPFGNDWSRTAKKLGRFGDRVFAGDFSKFDGTLNSCILSRFADLANDFYNDGAENALIRKVLLVDVFNSIHLCDGNYISLTHSQPSGNPLTTIINSFYNSVSMRIAYYRCFNGKAPRFGDHVSMVSYGDDNVINLSLAVCDTFNQNTVTKAYASFGMIYTDETKSGGDVAPWRKLTDVAYLKRGFRNEDGIWMAPLAMETILETCNWVRKSTDPVAALKENVEGCFRELAQWPESIFNSQSKMMLEAFYEATNVYPELKTRLAYLEDDSPFF